ncbi:MAG: glycosyltransferase [Archangium sp.]|nr:glycosyltransferase [Archangium sp.]
MKVLVYTSPARGHLYPLVPTLEELRRRGHQVAVRSLSTEVERVRALGFEAEPIDPAIEAREIDDWKSKFPPAALLAACRTFVDRGAHEVGDLRRAIARERPDVLFTDVNSWGAAAAAESSKLPWAVFAPYFLPLRAPGAPPWGLGLAPQPGLLGRVRDALLWPVVNALYNRVLPAVNALRASAGAAPYRDVADFAQRPPCIVSYTAEPFEYARAWPAHVRLVGPGVWEPPSEPQPSAAADARPLVLVTCSTEFQNDGKLVETALAALADEPVRVLATTASLDPGLFRAPPNARVERFVPHGPVLREAACVVCHGGMGITQKALSAGVPVCVVPFGRDQLEVARHVEVARAGTRLPPARLSSERLRRAIREAMALKPGALHVAERFRNAGGARAAAAVLEGLVAAAAAR